MRVLAKNQKPTSGVIVVSRHIEIAQTAALRNARLEALPVEGDTVEERLACIGAALIEQSLSEDFIGLMRLAIAEARRMPEMGAGLLRQCRERGGRSVVRLLAEGIGEPFGDADDPRALKAGRFFAEIVLLPFLLRALAEGTAEFKSEITAHARERARFFLAGLRNGGLDS